MANDKAPEAHPLELDFLHICDHAFRDSAGRPCVIGILDTIRVKRLPTYRPLITIAIKVRGTPNARVRLRFQLGPTRVDLSREELLEAMLSEAGTLFIPFHMPQFRFDVPGEYIARVADVGDGDWIMAVKSINVVLAT